jgi:hypothetical protein
MRGARTNQKSSTGFVYLSISDDNKCNGQDITLGIPVDTCFVESNFAYKLQLVSGIYNFFSTLKDFYKD